jgi:hypothetical protein
LLGRAGLVLKIFFPKSEKYFECDFSRVGVKLFSQRRSQGKNASNFGPRKGGFKIIFGLLEEKLASRGLLAIWQFLGGAALGLRLSTMIFFITNHKGGDWVQDGQEEGQKTEHQG